MPKYDEYDETINYPITRNVIRTDKKQDETLKPSVYLPDALSARMTNMNRNYLIYITLYPTWRLN